jgi:predicted pyridoxine 5'-phosphate oxidase superfamily flavin-nucleotide-binding protein
MIRDQFYHGGMREVQERFGGRSVADAIEQHFVARELTEEQSALISSSRVFFIATSWESYVDCSMKCGQDGFVRPVAPDAIEYPEYNGNSMYRTLGNLERNPHCGLLFVDFQTGGSRLRLGGRAEVLSDQAALAAYTGACAVVRIRVIGFPNCSRYRPRFDGSEHQTNDSADDALCVPKWKTLDEIAPHLRDTDPHFDAVTRGRQGKELKR